MTDWFLVVIKLGYRVSFKGSIGFRASGLRV